MHDTSYFAPYVDPKMEFCSNVWMKKRSLCVMRDVINSMLPVANDTELLCGGILSAADLHEMLI